MKVDSDLASIWGRGSAMLVADAAILMISIIGR